MIVTYSATLTNQRMLSVKGNAVQIEDRSPEEGGKPISADELALIERVRVMKEWEEFYIDQRNQHAWTKTDRYDPTWSNHLWLKDPDLRIADHRTENIYQFDYALPPHPWDAITSFVKEETPLPTESKKKHPAKRKTRPLKELPLFSQIRSKDGDITS